MYPPGQLFHYSLIYMIFVRTDKAEYILKLMHMILQVVMIVLVSKVGYSYFKKDQMKAQMICFLFIANQELRDLNLFCYNDTLLGLYVVLVIYFTIKNRPILASLMFTIGLSVKAGSFFILPAFLGIVQYRYGTFKLLACLLVMFVYQVIIALPFVYDPVALMLGFPNGAGNTLEKYMWQTRYAGGSADTRRGAVIIHTIYFFFLSHEAFHSEEFIEYTRIAILSVNIYYFFIRSGCVIQCLQNILPFNLKKYTNSERTKIIEVMTILYISGT